MIRRTTSLLACVCLVAATVLADSGNSWDRVRYNGGTLKTSVDPHDWDNKLTVTSDTVTFVLKDGQKVEFPSKNITGLSYGQEAHRRVGTMVALGIIVSPLALFGLFHKTRQHFIGIEFTTTEGQKSGLLLQGDKGNYRAIMTALEGASGAPVSVSEKDREFVPGLANVRTVKEAEGTGSVAVASTPDAADITVDGNFVGNTPATLKLAAGKHTVKVTLAGYQDWTREIEVSAGSDLKLNAAMVK